ncbi:hypothetical protein, partial [Flavobacterium sp. AJR]|uniref:hypothetical protein n=1 Tax=Flavobacterium sp. AJR TaxID=1979369 RepID=UPI001A9A0AB3
QYLKERLSLLRVQNYHLYIDNQYFLESIFGLFFNSLITVCLRVFFFLSLCLFKTLPLGFPCFCWVLLGFARFRAKTLRRKVAFIVFPAQLLLCFVAPSPDNSGNPCPFFFKKGKIVVDSRKQLLKKLLLYSIVEYDSYI